MLLLVIALGSLGASVYLIGEVITLPVRERVGSMQRASTYGRPEGVTGPADEGRRTRAFQPLKEKLARAVMRVNRKYTVEQISMRLLAAGLGRRVTPTSFLATKGVFAISGLVLGVAMGAASGGGFSGILFTVAFAGIGFIGPDFFISQKIRSRRETIRAQLPDALDADGRRGDRRVRVDVQRDAKRRRPPGGAQEDGPPRGNARGVRLRPGDRAGRSVRH